MVLEKKVKISSTTRKMMTAFLTQPRRFVFVSVIVFFLLTP
jgi:hypothetical protein